MHDSFIAWTYSATVISYVWEWLLIQLIYINKLLLTSPTTACTQTQPTTDNVTYNFVLYAICRKAKPAPIHLLCILRKHRKVLQILTTLIHFQK